MQTVTTLEQLRAARAGLAEPLGFVPTMGYLHEGHLALVRAAQGRCKSVIVSIFVNPAQFGPNEDLAKYPRDIPRDLALLDEAGVDLVWLPTPEMMYPPGFQTWVEVTDVSQPLEGAMRPGHFRGVATVVAKLFNAVGPDLAFFGQKDAQQVAVIRQMTLDLNFPLEVVVVPTAREADGLARSSRNVYLSEAERAQAPVLHRALQEAAAVYRDGERDAEVIRKALRAALATAALAEVQYVSCAHPRTLQELERIGPEGALLSMAVHFGKTRLIDNLVLEGH
ncbi:MAG: pantoate--beta-alanine ligase [Chloroflexi bacterium]|nr:pantoate--beta-alanine ligase [Chloroflexota bacterium]